MIKKIFPIILAGFLLAQPIFGLAENLCWDECPYEGYRQDSGDQYRICGDYDSDYCLEWSNWQTDGPDCWDECSYQGQHQCSGTSGKTCGNYDSDSCLEWSSLQNCDTQCYSCGDGTCNSQCGETQSNCSQDCGSSPPACWDECSYDGKRECTDSTHYRTCGNYDSDSCLEWSSSQSCGTGKTCQDGQCVALSLSVDVKANSSNGPITLYYKDYVTISWTSQNAVSCSASGDWSGSKSTSGSQTIQLNSVKTYTFTLTCQNSSSQTSTDSVQVIVQPKPPTVITKPAVVTL